jgi:hypothetical protein
VQWDAWFWNTGLGWRRWGLAALAVGMGWMCAVVPVLASWFEGSLIEPLLLYPAVDLGENGWAVLGWVCVVLFVAADLHFLEEESVQRQLRLNLSDN